MLIYKLIHNYFLFFSCLRSEESASLTVSLIVAYISLKDSCTLDGDNLPSSINFTTISFVALSICSSIDFTHSQIPEKSLEVNNKVLLFYINMRQDTISFFIPKDYQRITKGFSGFDFNSDFLSENRCRPVKSTRFLNL